MAAVNRRARHAPKLTAKGSELLPPMTDIIYGRHPVVAALREPDSPLEEVIVAQGAGGHWLPEVKRLARAAGVRLRIAERAVLDRLCATPNHQGIAARRGSYVYRGLGELGRPGRVRRAGPPGGRGQPHRPHEPGQPLPQRLRRRGPRHHHPQGPGRGVTAVVIKAAAGGPEYPPVYRVTNLADSLARLKEAGLTIVGTAPMPPRLFMQPT